MKPLRNRLQEARKRLGIPWEVLERDYDLWRVFGAYQNQLHLSDFSSFLHAKCTIRNVSFNGPDDFFEKTMLHYVEKTWEQWLGPLIPDLPDFSIVIDDLRPRIALLVS